MAKTLADKISRSLSIVKLKTASVKVPKLKIRKERAAKPKKDEGMPISSIINILIKSAVEKAKKEGKDKPVEEDKSYKILKDERGLTFNGGYGSVSKGYGTTPHNSYVDYGKLFSYLGSFRAKQPYENMAEHLGNNNKALDDRGFVLVSSETMEKGKSYIRYFNSKVPIAKNSLVPLAPGMNSKDWEEFIWFMRLDTAMYLLKISTS